ncbi:MAG: hypothetical protein OQK24_09115 [Magnetovibrio sp.]|nr:hypothetical protein [Magnetovibrio sp.]
MNQEFNAERRKHARHGRMGLIVRVGGLKYEVSNWSMGGFLLEEYDGSLSTGALVTVEEIGCAKTQMYQVQIPARVVRLDDRTMAVNYLSLDIQAYEFLTNALTQCGEVRSLVEG